MNVNNCVVIESKMSFEDFCKPFEETADMLSKKGITKEQLDEKVAKSRREYAKRYLRY